MNNYQEIKSNLAKGWNTWNTRSVLSYVLLPQCFAINLCIKEYADSNYLKEALIGRFGEGEELIHPGAHTYDGSYTRLNLKWRGVELDIETATIDDDLVVLVTPLSNQKYPASLVVEPGVLWNAYGSITREDNILTGIFNDKKIKVYTTKEQIFEPNIAAQTPYIAMKLEEAIGVSTGVNRTLEEIRNVIAVNRKKYQLNKEKYGTCCDVYDAMQSCMAWDTIYEPAGKRVITTVSRIWNMGWGGYQLFCWDTYFAAYMALVDNKELAYANVIEITREKTSQGFIPNTSTGSGFKTLDRSQPPVGSMVLREIYRKYKEKWILEELFKDLFEWNTWFFENRQIKPGLMAWGSNPYEPRYDNYWEKTGVNQAYGGALESGLDNSPMYDEIAFDGETHLLKLADAGLMGLYIMDCKALSDIAAVLDKKAEAAVLDIRIASISKGLEELWDEKSGIFLNKLIETGQFSNRLSPTNFYPLLSGIVNDVQAEAMMNGHFYNEEEFWGEWIMPSIARNDPAYSDQDYWRGRIWAPMNFLVYLGLRNCGLIKAQKDMALLSRKLILNEWLVSGHVHENYCADTGMGCGKANSDKFYHWGGLLSLISLIEEGFVDKPEKPL